MFHGSMVALVTPMKEDGSIDLKALRGLIDWHIEEGTDALVVLGTTGESATLGFDERRIVIETTLQQVRNRVPVIAGTGTNATQSSVELTRQAMDLGVDACLLVTPYYNKPTQEGLYQHYSTVAHAVAIPQILYNVPGRTACDLLPETVVRLAALPNIIGIKEASGKLERVRQILAGADGGLDVYSGEDACALDLIGLGGKGVISVTANVAPRGVHEMCQAALKGDQARAQAINERLMALNKALFVESNPIPAKWALYRMSRIEKGIRLPLTWLSPSCEETVLQAMTAAGMQV